LYVIAIVLKLQANGLFCWMLHDIKIICVKLLLHM